MPILVKIVLSATFERSAAESAMISGMKTVKRELVHTGMFGSDGTIITKADLADCAETFDGKCPVTLGHKLADWMPKFGNVKNVELLKNGESLLGDVEMHDELADAVAQKFYEDISVGIQTRKKDGKKYLHHLAFLGAIPPKIRDLQIFGDSTLCLGDDNIVSYHDKAEAADTQGDNQISEAIRRIADKGRAGWALEDVLKALADLTSWCMEMVASGAKIPDTLIQQLQQFSDTVAATGGKEESVEEAKLKEENAQLKKDLADARSANLASIKAGLVTAMEGKIPKGKQNLVLSLADALMDGAMIKLSDGDVKESMAPLDVLKRIIEAIPATIKEGRTDLGDESTEPQPLDLSKIAGKF